MFERKQPKVSIVIPSWFNQSQHGRYCQHETFWFAQECLRRLYAVTGRNDYEVIIVDNGSTITDEDVAGLEFNLTPSEYWKMADVLIRNKENLGFAPACNQGFAMARGEYVICLNNDILVWPGWLDTMINDFEGNPAKPNNIGILMPALVLDLRDARKALEMETIDLSSHRDQFGVKAEFGSLWMAKKDTLNKVAQNRDGYQVFDEKFLLGMGEDRWLYREVRMLGLETYRTHNTRVFHIGNMTIGKVKDRRDYTGTNREYLAQLKKEHNID